MDKKPVQYPIIVTILKSKNGIPTVIQAMGNTYILRHKDQKDGGKR